MELLTIRQASACLPEISLSNLRKQIAEGFIPITHNGGHGATRLMSVWDVTCALVWHRLGLFGMASASRQPIVEDLQGRSGKLPQFLCVRGGLVWEYHDLAGATEMLSESGDVLVVNLDRLHAETMRRVDTLAAA